MLRYVGDLWDDQKDHDLTRRKRFIQVAKLLALLILVVGLQPSTIPKLTSSKRYHVKLGPGIKTWRWIIIKLASPCDNFQNYIYK